MTNFEKWTNSLTPEDMVISQGGRLWAVYDSDGRICRKCPAQQYCEDCHKVNAYEGDNDGCGFRFLRWANKEAK